MRGLTMAFFQDSATAEYLFGPIADLYRPAIVTAVLIGLLASPLSVLVVLKRLAFIGQGVSHSAFGGVGLAVFLAAAGVSVLGPGGDRAALLVLSAVGAALAISVLSSRSASHGGGRLGLEADTAIGIVLVATMAVGFTLSHLASTLRGSRLAEGQTVPTLPSLESILFGSLLGVGWWDAAWTAGVAAAIAGAVWWFRRPVLLWAFDEPAAPAFGVATGRMRVLVLVSLALATVLVTRLAGIVLATAVLVLPGAAALSVSDRLARVLVLSVVLGLAGVLGGLVLSFEASLPPGPSVALAMMVVFAGSRLYRAVRPRIAGSNQGKPGDRPGCEAEGDRT